METCGDFGGSPAYPNKNALTSHGKYGNQVLCVCANVYEPSSTRLRELALGCYRPAMEEKARGHCHQDVDNAVSVGAGFIGDIDTAAASASAASSAAVAANDGGLNIQALIVEARSEIAELRGVVAPEDPPRK